MSRIGGYKDFIGKLVGGRLPAPSPSELNALLHWLAGRTNEAAVLIDKAFNSHGIPPDLARRHTLLYLDRTLFSNREDCYALFGLTRHCSLAQIRRRHKRLMQIFHPDRHTDDREWFTERTEQLNRAFAYLKANHDESPSIVPPPPPPVNPKPDRAGLPKPSLWRTLANSRNRIRRRLKEHLGNAAVVERRLYIAIYSVPVLILLLIYLGQAESNRTESRQLSAGSANAGDAGSSETAKISRERGISDPATPGGPKEKGDDEPSSGKAGPPGPTVEHADSIRGKDHHPNENYAAGDNRNVSSIKMSRPPGAEAPPVRKARVQTPVALHPEHDVRRGQEELNDKHDMGLVATLADGWIYQYEQHDQSPEAGRKSKNWDELAAVKALLSQYQSAYNLADVDQLKRLFHQNAVTESATGRTEIAETYMSVFNDTSRRRLVIKDIRIEQTDNHRFNISAGFHVDYTSVSGDRKAESGRMAIRLVMVKDEPKIRKLEHLVQ